jgi:excisionase family DNA binding protein
MAENDYFSIEEVAKTLKVSYITVYRWIRAKKLPSVKAGKQYRVKKSDLDNFIKVK